MEIIGRKEEQQTFKRLYQSGKPEFVALYGRRRVGKTYLVNTFFGDKISFSHTALPPEEESEGKNTGTRAEKEKTRLLQEQLDSFRRDLLRQGYSVEKPFCSWMDAFDALIRFLETRKEKRLVVFLDELPWMDTPRSGLLEALSDFWNSWGCKNERLLFIVCGSSASWMTSKLINSYGGLYDRITEEINLAPFSLNETEAFLNHLSSQRLSRYQITCIYMVFGGIPYYLQRLRETQSLAENLDRLFFAKQATFRNEFHRLFRASFRSGERMEKIVRALARKKEGYSRKDLLLVLNGKTGGSFSDAVNALLVSNFVQEYVPFGAKRKQKLLRLVDPFCWFYLKFVDGKDSLTAEFFAQNVTSPAINSWRGLAFENVCFNHIPQIKEALGIRAVKTTESAFISYDAEQRMTSQSDLLFDRADGVVSVCEMKFYAGIYQPKSKDHLALLNRETNIYQAMKKKKTIVHCLITTYGLAKGTYCFDYAEVVTLDNLFAF